MGTNRLFSIELKIAQEARMRRVSTKLVVVCAVIAATTGMVAQGPTFEVASIKPQAALDFRPVRSPPDGYYRRGITLSGLVSYAFDWPLVRVVGGPGWTNSDRWDIAAKADRVRPDSEVRQMVAALLEDRFALRTHREVKALPVFELVLARVDRRLGPRLERATGACRPFQTGGRPITEAPVDAKGVSACINLSQDFPDRTAVRLSDRTLAYFAGTLERTLGRPVVDKTGLDGIFDVSFDYRRPRGPRTGPADVSDIPELPTALRELLGLELRSATADVEVLVIDSVRKPTPN
jgi:uncharacterized protein (TIGR03435 family)